MGNADEVAKPGNGDGFLRSLKDGFITFRRVPLLVSMAFASAALNIGGSALGALYTLNAYRSLRLTPAEVGATFVVYSVASVLAVLSANRVIRAFGLARTITLFAPVAALSLILIPVADLGLPLLTLIVYEAIFGFSATVWAIATMSTQQQIVPSDRLGRAVAFSRTFSVLAIPVGATAGGIAAEIWGLQVTLTSFAIIAIVGTFIFSVRLGATFARTPVGLESVRSE